MSWNEPGGDNKDPWSGRGGDKKPPDLDQLIGSLQEKLSKFFASDENGGSSNNGGSGGFSSDNSMMGLGLLAGGALLLWGLSGFYIVDAGSQGVETRFGQYTVTTDPGLNWHLPAPIERVDIVNVKQQRFIEIGYRSVSGADQAASSVPKEALMLTKDENIIDVRLAVQYQVSNARDFLFNVANPIATLKQVTESVERAVVGGNTMDEVLTKKRSEVAADIKKEVQAIIDSEEPGSYRTGILVIGVNLQDAQPPKDVQDAFMDVVKANGDKERIINEAQAYYNDVVPKARGAAARKEQESEGYKEQIVAQATGEASRFSQLLTEYTKAPEIMRKRLYIETIESVLSEANTVLVNVKDGANNMLYLPLDKMLQQTQTQATAANSNPQPVAAEPTIPKPIVEEKVISLDRSTTRARDARGRNNAD